MPTKAVKETVGIIVYPHFGIDDTLWWTVSPPQDVDPERKDIWVYSTSDLLDNLIWISTQAALKRPRTNPPKQQPTSANADQSQQTAN